MTIAIVSKADALGGGASRVAELLTDGIRAQGQAAWHFCSHAGAGFGGWRKPLGGAQNKRIFKRVTKWRRKRSLAEVLPLEFLPLRRELAEVSASLVHFHDLSSAISPFTLLAMSFFMPVVWTLHDCSPFTGGCLYPMGCHKFTDAVGCWGCPQLGGWPLDMNRDTVWINHGVRRLVHATRRIQLVSPSKWLAQESLKSGIISNEIAIIPNGIEAQPFLNARRDTARHNLGIAQDKLVFAISAGHLHDKRKNISTAIRILEKTTHRNFAVILIGKQGDFSLNRSDVQVIQPGFITSHDDLAQCLAASDAYVFTSLADNHPLSILEAMASGTAIIGYATGGVPEQVTSGQHGTLVPCGHSDALQNLIDAMRDRNALHDFGDSARRHFSENFTREKMATGYLKLYARLLG